MRAIFTIVFIILVLWAVDAYTFNGYYGGSFEQKVQYDARMLTRQVQDWASRHFSAT